MIDVEPDYHAIWYVHVDDNDPLKASAGDWFYDPQEDVQCGQVIEDETGLWSLYLDGQIHGAYSVEDGLKFKSLEDVKSFVSNYFNRHVIDVEPKHLRLDDESY